ncbi:MAG: hypothetical protein SPJ48_02765, partial [Hallella sp.]
DIKKVIMLEVAESVEMKVDEYRHDFRPAHSPFPIAVLTPVWLTNGHAGNFLIIFLAKIIDNTENFCNFVLDNLYNYSILLFYN